MSLSFRKLKSVQEDKIKINGEIDSCLNEWEDISVTCIHRNIFEIDKIKVVIETWNDQRGFWRQCGHMATACFRTAPKQMYAAGEKQTILLTHLTSIS